MKIPVALLCGLVLVAAGCVPSKVHDQNVAQITELMSSVDELNGAMAAILGTQRLLEVAVVITAGLLALAVARILRQNLSKRGRR